MIVIFFSKAVLEHIKLFENVIPFLEKLKKFSETKEFKKINLEVHHFIVSAGLKDLIELVFPKNLITYTFGCRYTVAVYERDSEEIPESIPIFCMDETMKTRSIFEISKGVFLSSQKVKGVNSRVEDSALWSPFTDMVYVGDGDTDVPALSLIRSKGGLGVAVYDARKEKSAIHERLKNMRLDKRADLITAADFSLDGELYRYIENRCTQIRQRYEAQEISNI